MKRNMKDIRSWLAEADPLRAEPLLSEDDASRMRRAVVSAVSVRESPRLFWPRAIAIAALVVLMVAAGTLGSRRTAPLDPNDATAGAEAPPAIDERRQLQFATPGGTRIIWTLDPQFKIEGAVP
jgi:hypothetical protein